MNSMIATQPTVFVTLVLALANACGAISFTPLGDLSGGSVSSITTGISADGTAVVGYSSSANGNSEAFLWTATGGMTGLGDLSGGDFYSEAKAVSSDGSAVVGLGKPATGFTSGWRWTSATGLVAIPDLPGGIDNGYAVGISSDGVTVAGQGVNSSSQAEGYQWTAAGGHAPIGMFAGGAASEPMGISGDGTTVVGKARRATNYTAAFRWTAAGGMQDLGYLSGGDSSTANACSADGSVVVGVSYIANYNRRAFRWTASGGMQDLGLLGPTGTRSEALACSADGSVIVGYSEGGAYGDSAFVWDAVNGMRSIKTLVQGAGLAKRWTQFTMATGVSADGTKIAGYGVNSLGNTEAFLVDLNAPTPPPPPPATGGLVWTEDLPQTAPLKANSVLRLSYDNGTGVTDIASLTEGSQGGWGLVEYAGGQLLVASSATNGTGTRVHHPRYSPILVTNRYAYDLDFTPGYLWQVNGNSKQVIRGVTNGGFGSTPGLYDRTWNNNKTLNSGRFTNAVQVVGTTVYFSSSTLDPIGIYKSDFDLTSAPVAVHTGSGAGASSIYDFEVVGDFIYFGDITNNAIKRVNTDGTGLTTLVSNAYFPNSIDVTDNAIYWTELNTQLIRRSNLDGSNVVTIRETDNAPRGVTAVPLTLIDGPAPQAVAVTGTTTNYSGAIHTPVTLTTISTSGLPVSLEIVSGPATVSGNTITYTGAGAVQLRASQAGNASYAPASFDYYINSLGRIAQTITFDPLPDLVYAGSPIPLTLTATATSGMLVTFSVVSGPATRNNTTGEISVTGTGTVTIRASVGSNSTYASTSVDRTFNVTDASADPFVTFLTTAGVSAGQQGPNDDPDKDGISNLLEYGLGLSPNTADSAAMPDPVKTATHLTLTYRRAQPGLVYVVETSPTLAGSTWTSVGVNQGSPDTNGWTTASIPLGTNSGFLRISVTKGP